MKNIAKSFTQAVREGNVSGFSIDPDNPAMAYDPIDIDAPNGERVRFTGHGGYTHDQEHAAKHLTVDAVYTVEKTDISEWHTDVHLREVPGQKFNSVMFAAVEE